MREQAEALAGYLDRGGDPEVWFRSKGLSTAERHAVLDELPDSRDRLVAERAGGGVFRHAPAEVVERLRAVGRRLR